MFACEPRVPSLTYVRYRWFVGCEALSCCVGMDGLSPENSNRSRTLHEIAVDLQVD
jgi:hypothetical protein